MTHIACLPGDGIGPEVIAVARAVLDAAGFEATWSEHPVGWSEWCARGEPLPAATLQACRDADAVLFGAITSKPDDAAIAELHPSLHHAGCTYRSPIVRLRRALDLHANIRPVRGDGIDMVIVRENTEGLYAGFEREHAAGLIEEFPGLPADAAVSLRVITPEGMRRVAETAFTLAEQHGRGKVTLIEKANVLRATGGLVRRITAEVAADHAGIAYDELHVDAACALVVRDPRRFDVVLATNLFGDIFSDVAAEVAGGLATAASANIRASHALFEPVHGSAPDIAGRGIADPRGAVRAAAMMARHLGQTDVADRIDAALDACAPQTTTAAWQDALLGALAVVA